MLCLSHWFSWGFAMCRIAIPLTVPLPSHEASHGCYTPFKVYPRCARAVRRDIRRRKQAVRGSGSFRILIAVPPIARTPRMMCKSQHKHFVQTFNHDHIKWESPQHQALRTERFCGSRDRSQRDETVFEQVESPVNGSLKVSAETGSLAFV